tara:strand:- start:183 stop:2777 length:2595 start_codon:yes stop_codon:yes gene_type:complete
MPVSPQDFSLWARVTGNKYPSTVKEKAKLAPDVHRFIQNLDKEGMLEGKKPKKEESLGSKVAKGALVAGAVAGTIAAIKNKGDGGPPGDFGETIATARDKVKTFLEGLGTPKQIDLDKIKTYTRQSNPRDQQVDTSPVSSKKTPDEIPTAQFDNKVQIDLNTGEVSAPNLDEDMTVLRKAEAFQERLNKIPTQNLGSTEGERLEFLKDQTQGKINEIENKLQDIAANLPDTPTPAQPQKSTPLTTIEYKAQQEAKRASLVQEVEAKRAAMAESFKPVVEGETFGTSGAIEKPEDIGNAKLRARRTFGPLIDTIKKQNPDQDVSRMGRQMLDKARRDVDFDIAYKQGRDQGLSDSDAVIQARRVAGFDGGTPGEQTEYRKFLETVPLSSPLAEPVKQLLPQPADKSVGEIISDARNALIKNKTVEIVQKEIPGLIGQSFRDTEATDGDRTNTAMTSTIDNQIAKPAATFGGPSSTDKQYTQMTMDNLIDLARIKAESSEAVQKFNEKVQQLVSTTGMSRARAERQIFGSDEKVRVKNPKTGRTETIQKTSTEVGRKLQAALKEDLAKTAGFDTEDVLMGNRAEYIVDEDTAQDYSDAQTTGQPMRTATSFSEKREKDSAPLKRDDTRLKAIENIDPETRKGTIKTAMGKEIKGKSPIYDQPPADVKTRQNPYSQEGEDIVDRPSKEPIQRFDAFAQKDQTRQTYTTDEEGNPLPKGTAQVRPREGGSPGEDIYGRAQGFLGGFTSKTAAKPPTKLGKDPTGESFLKPKATFPKGETGDKVIQGAIDRSKPGTKMYKMATTAQTKRESANVSDQLRSIETNQSISPDERRRQAKDLIAKLAREKGISAMGQTQPMISDDIYFGKGG